MEITHATPTSEFIMKTEGGEQVLGTEGASPSSSDLLNIYLRINTNTPRLDSSIWDFLSLRDLYKLRILSKSTRIALEMVEYSRSRDGRDYLVPFPGYPGVLSTPSDIRSGAGLFTHQLASLSAMHRAENNNTSFGALRGGILGDAPGLGKTITMLSLIASTGGCKPIEPEEFYNNADIDEQWKIMRINPVFRTEILKSLKPIRHSLDPGDRVFIKLADYVSPPFRDGRLATIQDFEAIVFAVMRSRVPQASLYHFRRNVNAFKAGFDKSNRRFFSNLNNDKGRRMKFERNLIPCNTTLIIVPDALLEHWAEQIRRHMNLDVFADVCNEEGSRDVVYIDGVGDLSTARFPLNHSNIPMASPYDLIKHLIVVVPFSRIKEQYNLRKRQREEAKGGTVGDDSTFYSQSPLLQIRWFRIVVDEGHELGEHDAASDVAQLIHELAAERRWVLSGTPTTGDEDSSEFTSRGLDQLQRLLLFLRHDLYGTLSNLDVNTTPKNARKQNREQAKSAWVAGVKLPFLKKKDSGREELYRILREIMVMHKKEDIHLPAPIFKQGEVSILVPTEVQAIIVDAVCKLESITICDGVSKYLSILGEIGVDHLRQGNVDLRRELDLAIKGVGTSIFDVLLSEYLRTDNFQMLVDGGQASYIADTIKREQNELEKRGGEITDGLNDAPITSATNITSLSDKSFDRRPVKAVVYSQSHNNLLSVAEYLYRSFKPENIAELTEGKIADMSYELGRFRNGYKEGKSCPICGGWNEYNGKKLISCHNKLMEVTDADGQTYLIEPERIRRAVERVEFDSQDEATGNPVERTRLDGGELTEYSLSQKHWRVGDALCIDARDPHPILQTRWTDEKWENFGSRRCIQLAEKDENEGRDGYLGPLPKYEDGDDAVFVKLNKWQPCGRFHGRSRWYTGPSLESVEMQAEQQEVCILLLDASLSHGLDLSFVTHIFLLEPIDDAALLEQVTSRAHRLGCTGPVTIETVNVWQELDHDTKKVAKQISSTIEDSANKRTSTAVCEHCYRSFENMEKAENHEQSCDRNPDSEAVVDPFHLSSVYRDIRPPPPMMISLPITSSKNAHQESENLGPNKLPSSSH